MINISAKKLKDKELNQQIQMAKEDVIIEGCMGHRYIATASGNTLSLTIHGTPGNALGAYLDGATITVNGNVQDATGDTMNDGTIIIHGNAGDTLGYAMRGGSIYVKGNTGYRTGVHMKQYKEKCPVIVVGGSSGSFLGEYLAGGIIIVLGLSETDIPVGNFTANGIHGGSIWIRSQIKPNNLSKQVLISKTSIEDRLEIYPYLQNFSTYFEVPMETLLEETFWKLTPDTSNPYHQLYTIN